MEATHQLHHLLATDLSGDVIERVDRVMKAITVIPGYESDNHLQMAEALLVQARGHLVRFKEALDG